MKNHGNQPKTMKPPWKTMETNQNHDYLQTCKGSDDFSWQTNRHTCIIIYISSSGHHRLILVSRQKKGTTYLKDLDKAPRLSISIVIWILSSDTICQLNKFNTNSEAAMLSKKIPKNTTGLKVYVVPLKGCMNCLDKGPSQSSYLFSTIQYDLRPLARTIKAPVHYVQFVKYIFLRNRTTSNLS